MKLESLKSEKFTKLDNAELGKINGGVKDLTADSGVTVTWTKAENKSDDSCSDCDE